MVRLLWPNQQLSAPKVLNHFVEDQKFGERSTKEADARGYALLSKQESHRDAQRVCKRMLLHHQTSTLKTSMLCLCFSALLAASVAHCNSYFMGDSILAVDVCLCLNATYLTYCYLTCARLPFYVHLSFSYWTQHLHISVHYQLEQLTHLLCSIIMLRNLHAIIFQYHIETTPSHPAQTFQLVKYLLRGDRRTSDSMF